MSEPTWRKRGCGTALFGLAGLAAWVPLLAWLAIHIATQAGP